MGQRAPFEVPKVVKVGGRPWRVKRYDDLTARERTELGVLQGVCYWAPRRRQIHLNRHATKRALASTFLHELMHACAHARGEGDGPRRGEENTISHAEPHLLAALEQLRWRRKP
jgi:Zn-dependent peptidase ImmA (M78 family)